jgi:hypothetical protein
MKTTTGYFLTLIATFFLLPSCEKQELDPATENPAEPKSIEISPTIQTSPAPFFANLFHTFGGGWTGGDGVYSYPLPDGRILWTFGDSFLGTVNPDYTRTGPMINNTFVVQDGTSITTLHGGTVANPEAYVKPWDNANHWYWPGHGEIIDNKLHMFMLRMRSTGTGGVWGFEHVGTDMAVFSLPSLQLIDQYEVSRSTEYLMGVSTYREGNVVYVYGTRSLLGKRCMVAKLNVDNPDVIEYWNGTTWGSEFDGDAYLLRANGEDLIVSNQFTVFKYGEKYFLMTQEDFLGDGIYLYKSNSPTGPWGDRKLIFETPESGGNLFTYNAFLHKHIVHPTKGVLVSYSVNSQNFWDLFADARIYRPRFFWLKASE